MNTIYLVPFFLGTFSGFLATLPIGPAKILAIRKFLLISKGNENEVQEQFRSSNTILLASISGLIFAQILFFLAFQFPFLYSLWVKPHFFSFFFILILFIYLYQIKNLQFDIYNNQFLLKPEFNFSYQQVAFLETLLLQLLNPVILPNPVFCRLTDVFLFRYSTISTFFLGNFFGLLSGYGLFFLSTLFLLRKLEKDAPTIYRLVKIKIHKFFGIVFVIFSFLCLSRTPLPAIKPFKLKEIPSKFSFNNSQKDSRRSLWDFSYENFWPDSFFGYDKWKRPLRLISFDNKKSQSTEDAITSFNKMFFSQFFFESNIKDGNYRLYHNFPQSLSLISQNINSIVNLLLNNDQFFQKNLPESDSIDHKKKIIDFRGQSSLCLDLTLQDWIQEKKDRQNQIDQNINTKINQIEKDTSPLEELVQKKFSSFDNNKNKISKQMDPRLSSDIRGFANQSNGFSFKNISLLFLTKENFVKKDSSFSLEKKNLTDTFTKNKLKLFLTENSQKLFFLENKKDISAPLLDSSFEKIDNLKGISLEKNNRVEKKGDIGNLKNIPSETTARGIPWNEIFKNISFHPFSVKSQIEDNMQLVQEEKSANSVKLYKPMPLWNANFNKKELDLLKKQIPNKPPLRIFFPKSKHLADRQNFVPPLMPFFRRNEFPGTIKSRRGKAVCWKTFQTKPHSPLFINQLSSLKNFFVKQKKIQINQDVATRSWQPTTLIIKFLRDYLLSLQAYIRKYFKLPLLIIVKNFVRQLLFQPAEWEKDWNNLAKEVYIECDFYGKEISIGVKLPNFFAYDELKQIKIINPFQLRFWTRSFDEKSSIQQSENYSFLNSWGRETKIPFGKVKKSPSFWQILIERIKLILQYKILKNLSLLTPKGNFANPSVEIQKKIENKKIQLKSEIQKQIEIEESQSNLTKTEKMVRFNNFNKKKFLNYKTKKIKILDHSTQIVPQFNKKEKVTGKRPYTGKNMLILLQRQWFNFYRFFLKKERELFFQFKKKFYEIKNFYERNNTKITKSLLKVFYHFSRFFSFLYYRISKFINFLLIKFIKSQKEISSTININDLNPTKNLSQAYIIHSIWEDKMMSKPNITSLLKVWDVGAPLKNNLEEFLNEQGILGNEKPENLTESQWQKWLQNLRAYTPPLKLWALWATNYWTQAVEQYWKELPSSKLKSILNQEDVLTFDKNLHFNNSLNNQILNRFLEPHLPLFQTAQKQKKLWKFNNLSRNYTEINNDGDVDYYFNLNVSCFDKKTDYLFDTLKKGRDKNLLINSSNLSLLSQIKENKLQYNFPQQTKKKSEVLLEELPLIQREKRRFDFDMKLQTLRQRGNFFPVFTRRWKLKKLKNKLEKLAKNVIKKPQGATKEQSSSFSIYEKNKKVIQELFKSEKELKVNILENWNSKILDDELFMYTTVSSTLRFANRNIHAPSFNTYDSLSLFSSNILKFLDFNILLLEDIYLPIYLREIKILDCFEFEKNNQDNTSLVSNLSQSNKLHSKLASDKKEKTISPEMVNKWSLLLEQKENYHKDRQTIVRFLWPTHRLEDLGCINRFWMATANQSRFSMLRIQPFPTI